MQYQDPWSAFLKGNKDALSQIFLCYHDCLFLYGIKLCNNPDIVKDCIQDLFLKLWKNRSNLKPILNIKPYLFKSLRHHISDSLVLLKENENFEDEDFIDFSFNEEDFLIRKEVLKERRSAVIQALNKLTSRQREIIYLRYFQELDYITISRILSMSIQSVRNSIHRGINNMRKTIN